MFFLRLKQLRNLLAKQVFVPIIVVQKGTALGGSRSPQPFLPPWTVPLILRLQGDQKQKLSQYSWKPVPLPSASTASPVNFLLPVVIGICSGAAALARSLREGAPNFGLHLRGRGKQEGYKCPCEPVALWSCPNWSKETGHASQSEGVA